MSSARVEYRYLLWPRAQTILALANLESKCCPPGNQELEVKQLQASADSALLARTLRREDIDKQVLEQRLLEAVESHLLEVDKDE